MKVSRRKERMITDQLKEELVLDNFLTMDLSSGIEGFLDYIPTSTQPNMWEGKKPGEILKDISRAVEKIKTLPPPEGVMPNWSMVPIRTREEYERLSNVRRNIPFLFNYPIGRVFFLGYTPEMADRWYIPDQHKILEVKPLEPEIENVEIIGSITL